MTNQKIRWDNAVWAAHLDNELLKQYKVSASTVRLVALAHATKGVDFDTLRVWFAVDTVATLTGISEKQVRQARKVLVEMGAMVKDGYYAIPGGKGKRTERFYLDPAALEGTVIVTGPSDEVADTTTGGNGNDDRSLPRGNGNGSEGTVMVTDNKNNNITTTTDKNNKETTKASANALSSIQDSLFEDINDSLSATPPDFGGVGMNYIPLDTNKTVRFSMSYETRVTFETSTTFDSAPAKRGDREGYQHQIESGLLYTALRYGNYSYEERMLLDELVLDKNYTVAEAKEFIQAQDAA